jgi:hypothetical protein
MTTDRPHDQLAASLVRGQLLYPEDPGYDRALSTWNLQATKRLVCTITTSHHSCNPPCCTFSPSPLQT